MAGFPVQKLAFLPGDTPQEVVDAYTAAFQAVTERGDFADISSKRVGKYPVFVGDGSKVGAANCDKRRRQRQGLCPELAQRSLWCRAELSPNTTARAPMSGARFSKHKIIYERRPLWRFSPPLFLRSVTRGV